MVIKRFPSKIIILEKKCYSSYFRKIALGYEREGELRESIFPLKLHKAKFNYGTACYL